MLYPRWLRLAPAAVALWVAASWPIGLAVDPGRLKRPGEVAYLLADVGILLPLAIAAAVALHRRSPSSRGLLATMLGALAYDATHFGVRTMQELSITGARLAVSAGLLLLLVAIGVGLHILLGTPRPPAST